MGRPGAAELPGISPERSISHEHELQRIPGSLLLPLDDINAESAARVLPDKNALTYVYCRSGVRSTAACEKLEALGYTNLYNLGGLTTWPYEVE